MAPFLDEKSTCTPDLSFAQRLPVLRRGGPGEIFRCRILKCAPYQLLRSMLCALAQAFRRPQRTYLAVRLVCPIDPAECAWSTAYSIYTKPFTIEAKKTALLPVVGKILSSKLCFLLRVSRHWMDIKQDAPLF